MNSELSQFLRFVDSQTENDGRVPAFVGDWAESYITEENVDLIVQHLVKIGGTALSTFIDNVNDCPHTDKGWENWHIIGPGVPDTPAEQSKFRDSKKRLISIIRASPEFKSIPARSA